MEKNQGDKQELLHDFNQSATTSMFTKRMISILLVVVLLGIGSGYVVANSGGKIGLKTPGTTADKNSVTKGTVVGSDDTKTFNDSTEGVLKEGGIEGEGQYHLVRPGGDSQNVYLTSSNVDLSLFIDRKIKVWGQTNTAQTAGWLMDVGKVEVLN